MPDPVGVGWDVSGTVAEISDGGHGDVAHLASVLDDQRFPAFADDCEAQSRSAARLRKAGFRVQPGHDPDVLRPGVLRI